jgi:hypothetical protein
MELEAILELCDDAAAQSEYDTAYHLLMAALYVAEHRRDRDAVERIAATGARLGAAVEAVSPPHRLSRDEAHKRGHTAIYDSLDAHAKAVRLRLDSAERLAKASLARA